VNSDSDAKKFVKSKGGKKFAQNGAESIQSQKLKQLSSKMPHWVEEDDLEGINEVIESGGLAKTTKKREAQCQKNFEEFLKIKKYPCLDILLMNKDRLQAVLIRFFHDLRVREDDLPKKATVEAYRSFLKKYFLRLTEGQFDISCESTCSKFTGYYKVILFF
jgi:hypothetical protein